MDGWIELGVWAALICVGVWLAWPRETEPRWVRVLERGLPVRGRWARRLIALPVVALSLFPLVQTATPIGSDCLYVLAGHCLTSPIFPLFPPSPQGFSYARGWRGSGAHSLRLRIGYWEGQVVWLAGVDRG